MNVLKVWFGGLRQKNAAVPVGSFGGAYFEVDNAQVSEFIVDQLLPTCGTEPFPLNELHLMVAALCRIRPQAIYAAGSQSELTVRIFGESARHFGLDCEIRSIGPLGESGLGLSRETAPASIQPPRVLFFIGGEYGFDALRAALAEIAESCPGASILAHNTFFQEAASGYNIGPRLAISAFLHDYPAYQLIETKTGRPGMTLLYQALA